MGSFLRVGNYLEIVSDQTLYLYIYELMDSCFIQWVIICNCHLFWCSNFSRFGQWEPLQDGWYIHSACTHHLSISWLSGSRKCSSYIFLFQPFSMFVVLFYRNQALIIISVFDSLLALEWRLEMEFILRLSLHRCWPCSDHLITSGLKYLGSEGAYETSDIPFIL